MAEEARIRIVVDSSQVAEAAADEGRQTAGPRVARRRAKPGADRPGEHREALGQDEVGAVRAFLRGASGGRDIRPEGILRSAAMRMAAQVPGVSPIIGAGQMAVHRARAASQDVQSAKARAQAVEAAQQQERRERRAAEEGRPAPKNLGETLRQARALRSATGRVAPAGAPSPVSPAAATAPASPGVGTGLGGMVAAEEGGGALGTAGTIAAARAAKAGISASRAAFMGSAAATGIVLGGAIAAATPRAVGFLEGVLDDRMFLSGEADALAAGTGAISGGFEGLGNAAQMAAGLGIAGRPGLSSEERQRMIRATVMTDIFEGVLDNDIQRVQDRLTAKAKIEVLRSVPDVLAALFMVR